MMGQRRMKKEASAITAKFWRDQGHRDLILASRAASILIRGGSSEECEWAFTTISKIRKRWNITAATEEEAYRVDQEIALDTIRLTPSPAPAREKLTGG